MIRTRIPTLERRHSGVYAPPAHAIRPTNDEIRALIALNPWHDPALKERLNGNRPQDLVGIDPDQPGTIVRPRNNKAGYQELIKAASTAGPAKASWTTAVTGINPQDIIVWPANYFDRPGQVLRITAQGGMGTLVTTPGTTTFELRMGPTANIVAFTTGAIQLNATAHTLLPFCLVITLTLRAIGITTSANFMGMGVIQGAMFTVTIAATDLWGRVSAADAHVSHVQMQVPQTAPAVGTGWDSTVASIMDLYAARSISNAANTMTIHNYLVESLN